MKNQKPKFTPGPWNVTKDCRDFRFREPYAVFNSGDHDQSIAVTDNESVARLIASAPEMFGALERLIEISENTTVNKSVFNLASDVYQLLAKIRGES